MQKLRRLSQYLSALMANSYWLFPWRTAIYQGVLKHVCFPGLNCYSCPAAITSCPLGALQNFLATLRVSLSSGQFHFGSYVLGTIGLAGTAVGRMPCGWICPFGLIQELLFSLSPLRYSPWRPLRWGPYVFLGLFVIVLPLTVVDSMGYGSTWFCKYVCPAGTLEAGLPLILMRPGLRRALGWLFVHKLIVLLVILGASVVISRPFCRMICPLGALYGILNHFSWFQLTFDADRCVGCKACRTVCPTEVSFFDGRDNINSAACVRCLKCVSICPTRAVGMDFGLMTTVKRPEQGKGTG